MVDENASLKGKKILLAEDDTTNQELMKDILGQMECLVDIAKDGNEVVEKYKNGDYDLILMDILMPGKDGNQATQEIRQINKGGKRIPIFALTASVVQNKESLMAVGIDEMVSKPIEIADLKKKMIKFLCGGS